MRSVVGRNENVLPLLREIMQTPLRILARAFLQGPTDCRIEGLHHTTKRAEIARERLPKAWPWHTHTHAHTYTQCTSILDMVGKDAADGGV